jgi:hypothetical protein
MVDGKLSARAFLSADCKADAERMLEAVFGSIENLKIEEDKFYEEKIIYGRRVCPARAYAFAPVQHSSGYSGTDLAGKNYGRGFAG